jgi:predicted NBD/HSP70 family sugar kinase
VRKIDLSNFQVATSGTARDINRRILLNLVRRHQPVSRADLSRCSGLQRSTVSSIIEELIDDRWVMEGEVGQLPRGRKPMGLLLNSERAGIIAVDVQPAISRLAVAGIDGKLFALETLITGRDPADFIERLSRRILELVKAHPRSSYEGIGVSLPGRVDLATHQLVFAPNLRWNPVDMKTPLEKATGLPVELENAANACALAELWSGRQGDSIRNIAAVTVSEGIGVGMIMNGQLVRGSTGMAGEFGHMTIVADGPQCRCGNRGCWEVLGSNAAALRYYGGGVNGNAKISFGELLELSGTGEPRACKALERMAQNLGLGISMLVTGLAPDVLVVVGEVTHAWDRVGPIVEEIVRQRSYSHASTRIVPLDPEPQPRLRGTVALVLQKHFGAPFFA